MRLPSASQRLSRLANHLACTGVELCTPNNLRHAEGPGLRWRCRDDEKMAHVWSPFGAPKVLGSFGLEGRIDKRQSIVKRVEVFDVANASRQPFIAARTTPAKKAQFVSLAASRGMSESALLTLLIDAVLEENPAAAVAADSGEGAPASGA